MLDFDAEKHEYRDMAGNLVPSVTQILAPLSNFSFVNPEVLAAAQAFGTAVHLACELHDLGRLDESLLDPALVPYLDSWKKFCVDYETLWAVVEGRVHSSRMGYAGTLDRAGIVRGRQSIVDIKSGSSLGASVGPQLAAYAHAYSDVGRSWNRYAVRLYDGGYEVKQYTSHEDWPVFASLLTLRKFCERNHITPNFYQPKQSENV